MPVGAGPIKGLLSAFVDKNRVPAAAIPFKLPWAMAAGRQLPVFSVT